MQVPKKIEDIATKKINAANDPRNISTKKLTKSNPMVDHKTLEQLHRKAQELLTTRSTSSSDVSSASEEPETIDIPVVSKNRQEYKIKNNSRNVKLENHVKVNSKGKEQLTKDFESDTRSKTKVKEKKVKKCKPVPIIVAKQNGPIVSPGRLDNVFSKNIRAYLPSKSYLPHIFIAVQ